jgi:glycine betaine/proline transport system substrate-binding protein
MLFSSRNSYTNPMSLFMPYSFLIRRTGKIEIVRIDPGIGHMELTANALKEYDLTDWNLTSDSGAAMTAALIKAYDKEELIIVRAWTPHWMSSKFDLKSSDDPKLIFGDS